MPTPSGSCSCLRVIPATFEARYGDYLALQRIAWIVTQQCRRIAKG